MSTALADQPQFLGDGIRAQFTSEARRDRIVTLLTSRGVQSPLLQRLQADPDGTRAQDAVVRLAAINPQRQDPQLDLLLALIGSAEAGSAGYDAIHHRARILPGKAPTELTVAEILDWIAATPRQNHAIGRYQIIPMTLNYLIAAESVPPTAVFTPDLQDRLAKRLIEDAGLPAFLAGEMSPADFLDSLAFVWAGLPLGSGLSAYEGFAGNSATISRDHYEDRFVEIFGLGVTPIRLASQSGPAIKR